MDSLKVCAYWRDRPENLDDCAGRLQQYLLTLGEASELFRSWVSKRRSPIGKLGPQPSRDDVRKLLGSGVNRKDFGGEPMPELGFSAALWNGRTADGEAATLSATCGLAAGNAGLSNSTVLQFPAEWRYSDQAGTIQAVFRAAVRCWEPDWAWLGSDDLRDSQDDDGPWIGLLTYVGAGRYSVDQQAAEAAGSHIERLPSGVLVTSDAASVADRAAALRTAISGTV